jgi:DNA-binding MarR family transcriptional regulator
MSVPFLKGPIPIAWLNVAAKLPGKTLNVGIAIWWLAGMSKTTAFKLTGKSLNQLGVSRDAASDGLKRLEECGLVLVKRSPGQRPTVQILPIAQDVTKRENTG